MSQHGSFVLANLFVVNEGAVAAPIGQCDGTVFGFRNDKVI